MTEKQNQEICADPECGHKRVFHSNYPPKKYLKDGECTKCHFEKVDNPCRKFTPKKDFAYYNIKSGEKPKNHIPHSGVTPVKKGEKSTLLEDTPSDKVSSDTLCLPEGTQNQESYKKILKSVLNGISKQNQEKGCGKKINMRDNIWCGKDKHPQTGKYYYCKECQEKEK